MTDAPSLPAIERLVKAVREWVHYDCPRATARLPTEQAIVDALAAFGPSNEVELELARRDTAENTAPPRRTE